MKQTVRVVTLLSLSAATLLASGYGTRRLYRSCDDVY